MDTSNKYRKKPVVIDAFQLPALDADAAGFAEWAARVEFDGYTSEREGCMAIETLEGTMTAEPGDWIIKGIKGEFYPCKPEIFAASYESAALAPSDAAGAPIYQAKIMVDPKWTDVTKAEFDKYSSMDGFDTRIVYAAPVAPAAVAPKNDMKEGRWCPDECPITGLEFFMWLDHPELGYVPTYGGPFDSFTLATLDEDGLLRSERYDHDRGEWIEGGHPMTARDELIVSAEVDDEECLPTPESERAAFNGMMRWHLIRLLQAWRYGGDLRAAGMAAFEWARTNDVGQEAFKASEGKMKFAAPTPTVAADAAAPTLTAAQRAVITDAMRSVAEHADGIKAGGAFGDDWPDAEDKVYYDAQVRVLDQLRALLGHEQDGAQ